MNVFAKINTLQTILTISFACALNACSQHDYTTWHCSSPTTPKITMVLDGSEMRIHEQSFKFCGSLGSTSYFASSCPSQTNNAPIRFRLSQGELELENQTYECKVL